MSACRDLGGRVQHGLEERFEDQGAVDELVLAVASCQLYSGGLFNAFEGDGGLAFLEVARRCR